MNHIKYSTVLIMIILALVLECSNSLLSEFKSVMFFCTAMLLLHLPDKNK